MYLQSPPVFRHIPYPIGKLRIYSAILLAFFSGIVLFWASTSLGWFTVFRLPYLIYSLIVGILLALLETQLVLSKLSSATETIVWQIWVSNIVFFGAPLLLVTTFFGISELLPFITYVFPAIPVFFAVSGWYFSKFETANKVNVFVFYFGFKYWKFPNPTIDERFQRFLHDIASKDITQFWGQAGSSLGYVGYSHIFLKMIKKNKTDSSNQNRLCTILKTMDMYRKIILASLSILLISAFTIIILILGANSGFFQVNIVQVLGPASGLILFGFFIGYFLLVHGYQRKMSKLLQE